jgi:beta-ureidopropionase / N-carbamoyl-L-amino-acid hydrolase
MNRVDAPVGPARLLHVDPARLMQRLGALGEIDRKADGSCCRLALTGADRIGRDMVVGWMRDAGLSVQVDQIGNIFGVRQGREDLEPVMTGSHIDTVATGGLYDGAYGVVAGLEAIAALDRAHRSTRRPIAVAVFTNEEGVRFQPDMMGSLVFSGQLPLAEALAAQAADGAVLGEELVQIGYAGVVPCGQLRPHAFVELHIEQGPVLDREGGVLGAVEDLQGISWQEVTVVGVANHAGTTPMNMRMDAGYCAAEIAVFVRALAERMADGQVATVGSIRLSPNLVNVIAREAVLSIDLRNTDDTRLAAAEAALARHLGELAAAQGVRVSVRQLARSAAVRFDPGVLAVIEGVARDLARPIRRMTSGAGHDAQMISAVSPTAMIFVPSVGGVSHNPREYTHPEHLELGANVLVNTLIRLSET